MQIYTSSQLNNIKLIFALINPLAIKLISVLYDSNPMDQAFLKSEIEDVYLLTIEDLKMLQQLDSNLFHSKKPGFLKRTEEQRMAMAEKKSEQKLQLLNQKVDKKRFELVHSTQFANQYEKYLKGEKSQQNQRQT